MVSFNRLSKRDPSSGLRFGETDDGRRAGSSKESPADNDCENRFSAPAHDEWSRVGEYLDRLAFENDRLEAELKLKKERRLQSIPVAHELLNQSAVEGIYGLPVELEQVAPAFDEQRETARYESRTATETATGMHLSYDALRKDLSGLMSDLNDFKHTRAGLESRLGA